MFRSVLTASCAMACVALAACSPASTPDPGTTVVGSAAELGDAAIQTYVIVGANDSLRSIGVRFGAAVVDAPPIEPDGTAPCFDVDGNGTVDAGTECFIMLRRSIPMPPAAAPFQWLQFNWNPEGHPPPAPPVYADPHFDFHFFIMPEEMVEAELSPGTCGFLLDCTAFERAIVPVPDKYTPAGYISVDAAAAEEGNHLIDPSSPELADPPKPFTHTMIYGSLDGHIIFYEPMITRAYLQTRPNACFPLKLPEAWEVAGSYPTEYCIRYGADEGEYTVSLESFVAREAG